MKSLPLAHGAVFAALLGLAAVPGPARADEFRIRAVTAVPGFPTTEVFAHDPKVDRQGTLLDVKAFLNHEADTIDLRGKSLVFTSKASPDSVEEADTIYGRCEVAGGRGSGIFVFLPTADEKVPGTMVEVDDGGKNFPAGSVMVVNHSTLPIRIELGDAEFEFKPGESRAIGKFPEVEGAGAPMKASFEREGQWTNFSSSMWPAPGSKRVLQLIYENPRTGRVEIRGIRDVASIE